MDAAFLPINAAHPMPRAAGCMQEAKALGSHSSDIQSFWRSITERFLRPTKMKTLRQYLRMTVIFDWSCLAPFVRLVRITYST
jgi:hypothetical protein